MDTLTLHHQIDILPPSLRHEVSLFLDSLIKRHEKKQPEQRIFGSAKGKIHVSEDFDEPLTLSADTGTWNTNKKTDDALITKGLQQLSSSSHTYDFLENEPELYTINDLKVRFI